MPKSKGKRKACDTKAPGAKKKQHNQTKAGSQDQENQRNETKASAQDQENEHNETKASAQDQENERNETKAGAQDQEKQRDKTKAEDDTRKGQEKSHWHVGRAEGVEVAEATKQLCLQLPALFRSQSQPRRLTLSQGAPESQRRKPFRKKPKPRRRMTLWMRAPRLIMILRK